MDYKEALFEVVKAMIDVEDSDGWDQFPEKVFGILNQVDDKKGLIEFLAELSDDDAITNLGSPWAWVVDSLAKAARAAVGITKEPEAPKQPETPETSTEPHGETSSH